MPKFLASLAMIAGLIASFPAGADERPKQATLYKDPQCGCCEAYADHLRARGYSVAVRPTHDLALIKRRHGVPPDLAGCHTMLVDGYVVEGHVPASILGKLLSERPAIKGISLPGMPTGSPGMGGPKREPFTVYVIGDGPARVYAVE